MINQANKTAFVTVEDGVVCYGLNAEVSRDEAFRLVDELDRIENELRSSGELAQTVAGDTTAVMPGVAPGNDEFCPTLRLVVAN